MADKRVIEQTASSEIYNDDWFLKDSVLNGTTKISAENLAKGLIDNVDASDIAYDNSESGLTATNVQDAIDETFENAGKVDDVKVDGTSVVTNKVAEIEIPVKDVEVDGTSVVNASGVAEITLPDVPVQDVQVKTDSTYDSVVDDNGNAKIDLSSVTAYGSVPNLPQAIATFKDGADAPMKSLKVAIEPQQDLHGYDSPWVGGAGKNKAKVTDKGKNGITPLNTYNSTLQISGNEFILTPTASSVEAYFGSISFSSSSSESSFNTFYSVPIKENTQYTFNLSNNNFDKNIIQFFDDSYNVINQSGASYKQFNANTGTVTAPTGATWMVCRIGMSSGTAGTAYKTTLQIEEGSTATTFAPYSNICPISGWDEADVTRTGKNLYSATLADYSSAQIAEVGLATFYPIKVPYGTYTISTNAPTGYIWAGYNIYDSTTLPRVYEGNPNTVTTDIIWVGLLTSDMSSAYAYNIMINQGSTPSFYEPYNGQTYTIDLDGTRYGGTLDVVSGVLTVDRAEAIYDGSSDEDWSEYDYNTIKSFRINISDMKILSTSEDLCMCDRYKYQSFAWANNEYALYGCSGHTVYFRPPNDSITSLSAFKTWLSSNNIEFIYPLATPLTIQLTPTAVKSLLGSNNVWADTGDINDCIYRRDMSSTIDDIIARLEALEG